MTCILWTALLRTVILPAIMGGMVGAIFATFTSRVKRAKRVVHARALKRIVTLMGIPKLSEAEGLELDGLSRAVEEYEEKEFPI